MQCRLCRGMKPGSIRFKLAIGMLVLWTIFILISAVSTFYLLKTPHETLIAQKQVETVSVICAG